MITTELPLGITHFATSLVTTRLDEQAGIVLGVRAYVRMYNMSIYVLLRV
jgi:hypothetical protein